MTDIVCFQPNNDNVHRQHVPSVSTFQVLHVHALQASTRHSHRKLPSAIFPAGDPSWMWAHICFSLASGVAADFFFFFFLGDNSQTSTVAMVIHLIKKQFYVPLFLVFFLVKESLKKKKIFIYPTGGKFTVFILWFLSIKSGIICQLLPSVKSQIGQFIKFKVCPAGDGLWICSDRSS